MSQVTEEQDSGAIISPSEIEQWENTVIKIAVPINRQLKETQITKINSWKIENLNKSMVTKEIDT